MGAIDGKKSQVGFQSSETTGVEVTIHHQGGDPVLLSSGRTPLEGRTPRDDYPAISAVNTTKSLGAMGQWNVTLKPARRSSANQILEQVVDDDWVDIVFFQHEKPFHVMRGLVDDIRRTRTATSEVFTLVGSDFQKVWEQTPMWFDMAAYENVGGAAMLKVTGAPINKKPDEVVKAYLLGFLEAVGNLGRANWAMPKSMPGDGKTFIEQLWVDASMSDPYGSRLDRRAVNPNFAQTSGSLWNCATTWGDPLFMELFTDIIPVPNEKFGEMNVIFRMKTFPCLGLTPSGVDAPFFKKVQRFTLPRQQIQTDDLGRSGRERFNDFRVGMETQQEWGHTSIDLTRPLWKPDDMLHHGQRMFDVNSKYITRVNTLQGLNDDLRGLVRDWYCVNPYLLNGTITLACGRPDIRIGTVVRIPGDSGEDDQETFYVETVNHAFTMPRGTRTTLNVTRGWQGSDAKLVDLIKKTQDGYLVPPLAKPGATSPGGGTSGEAK